MANPIQFYFKWEVGQQHPPGLMRVISIYVDNKTYSVDLQKYSNLAQGKIANFTFNGNQPSIQLEKSAPTFVAFNISARETLPPNGAWEHLPKVCVFTVCQVQMRVEPGHCYELTLSEPTRTPRSGYTLDTIECSLKEYESADLLASKL